MVRNDHSAIPQVSGQGRNGWCDVSGGNLKDGAVVGVLPASVPRALRLFRVEVEEG